LAAGAPLFSSTPAGQAAREVAARLKRHGFLAFFAGGCVRDALLGRAPKDLDLATDARPEDVLRLFPGSRQIGRAFPVVLVHAGEHAIELATFRRDADYPDGRHPSQVTYSRPEEDAQRRDFTINGLFYDPAVEQILDFVDGQRDLAARRIRAIGDPRRRFDEDHLRLLRAVRFAATLDFELDPNTAMAIRERAERIRRISAERIAQELTRLWTESPRAGHALELLHDSGLLAVLLPEVVALRGVQQPPEYHPEGDVFRHTSMMLDLLQHPTPELAWAVLLHDIGKPATYRVATEPDGHARIRFDRHAAVGAEMAAGILGRLRMSAALTEHVVTCVRQHMRFIDVQNMRPATLRRLVGAPTFATELELHRVDCLASHRNLENYDFVRRFAESLRDEPAVPPPWITGRDLLALGVPEGPAVGRWRERAWEAQLDGRFTTREELLAWLRQKLAEDGPT
jgi:poly(A) polymerase